MAIRNNLDDIVNVDIEISTPGSSDESFNNVLLVVEGPVVGKKSTDNIGTKVISVAQAGELADYGFSTESQAYIMANVAFSQSPKPSLVYVIARQVVSDESDPVTYEKISVTLDRAKEAGGWYGIALSKAFLNKADIEETIKWTEANKKIFGFTFVEQTLPVSTTNYFRSFAVYGGGVPDVEETPDENYYISLAMMSIKNVYAQIVSFDNLLQAEKDARAGKRYENEQLAFWGNLEDNIHSISEKLKCHNYPPDIYHHFYVYEPKLRKVIFSDYTTKVIQRAAYNVLNPIVCKGMISDTYSCIEDRGQLKSMQRLAGWVDFVEKSGERWYYLKMDVEKFFYRMDHEVLMSIIQKKIGDKEAVRFLEHYVCHASRAFGLPLGVKSPLEISDKEMLWDVGIAIGGGLSHMYGNMYLNPMDQMAKRKEGIQYYIRYMDDVIILSTDKELLHRYKNMFSDFLGDVLKLRLNNKTAIRPVSHGMEFVGYTIRPFDVRLRKSTSLRMKRHLKTIQELYRDYEIDLDRARSTLMSYKALMDHCDCRALEKKIFEDFVLTHNPKEADTDNG